MSALSKTRVQQSAELRLEASVQGTGHDVLTLPAAADRMGVYNVVTISSLIMCVMFWVWNACTTKTACIILVVIQGAAGGAFVSLQAPMATQTATDMRYGGTMVGQALCEF